MRFLLDPDSRIMAFISRFADMAVLNVVFLLTCIPIFTIGAANTALYAAVFPMDTEREGKLPATCFRAFRQNYRQNTVIWLLLMLLGAATCFNMVKFSQLGGILRFSLVLLAMFVLILLLLVCSYAFPLLSRFQNSTGATAKNALLPGIAHLPGSLVLMVIHCFPWVIMFVNLYAFTKLSFLWLFLYFSAAAYIGSRVLLKVFAPLEHT